MQEIVAISQDQSPYAIAIGASKELRVPHSCACEEIVRYFVIALREVQQAFSDLFSVMRR